MPQAKPKPSSSGGLDRIAGSVVDFGTLLDEGVSIISATEPLDTTSAMGRATAEILQVFAAMEARATSARVTNSIAYLRRNYCFPGGLRPYGYRSAPAPTGSGKVLEIDPAQAVVIREAADRVLAGETVYAVARDFTTRNVPTARHAKGWTHTALHGVLVGDAVLGRVTLKGELMRDEHGLPRAVWPAILTVEESSRLRAILAVTPAAKHPGYCPASRSAALADTHLWPSEERTGPRSTAAKPTLAAFRAIRPHQSTPRKLTLKSLPDSSSRSVPSKSSRKL